mgnify:FL=1
MRNFLLSFCAGGILLLGSILPVTLQAAGTGATGPRERILIDDGWRFALGHATDPARDFGFATGYFSYLAKTGFGDGPADPLYDDRWWREVDLPHDWAVEMPFDPAASFSHGFKAVGPGFPENSVGWYRKTIHIPESDLGRRIRVEFEGIYRDARVFVNGFFVGREPSGYVEQSYDISEYLNYGGDNVIAVRADASMEEGWYYEGAGIYRHAWLSKTGPVHVARYGTVITSKLMEDGAADLLFETTVVNEKREDAVVYYSHDIRTADGVEVAACINRNPHQLAPGERLVLRDPFPLPDARLWDLEDPYLYTLVTLIKDEAGNLLDRYETTFGIRDIHFDPDRGFFLNGKHVKLKGTNNHQDHAGVGTAIPDALQVWRLKQLKAMGSNAYRASHHPASPALLDACDRLGILVIDENRLMGINDYHLGQLEHLIVSRRNHPSIIMWSLGNEEWGIEGNIKGARITEVMQAYAHRLDPTRPVTVAISGGWGGISTVVEAMGVNYIRHGDTDRQHRDYPWQIIVGTEETTTQATRGIYVEDAALAHQPPREDGSSGGNAESGWRHYAERDYAAGVFYWTGFDYRGEPTPYVWPAVLSQFGILDNCGFPKDSFYYLKAWWTDEPVLHLFPHWNWPGREGQPVDVRVQSNAGSVELFLNGESLGRKEVVPNDHLSWMVPYEPGILEAHGAWPDGSLRRERVSTTGAPAVLRLVADREVIRADGDDLSVVTVEVRDAEDRIVPTAGERGHFSIEGPGRIIGVGNGDPSCLEPDRYVDSVRAIELDDWTPPPAADTGSPVVFEMEFDRPGLAEGEQLTLLLAALGTGQTATLNGREIYVQADPQTARASVDLDPEDLRESGNVLRIEARPFSDWGARENVANNPPAILGIHTPAEPYRRSTFNGLAQVLVQGTGSEGTITLQASSEGLEPANLTIRAR